MIRPAAIATALLLGAAAAFVPTTARADRAAADYFVQRGDKSLKERKWADAQGLYRKALEEDEHHVPARVGLGESLIATGDRQGAIDAWRRAVTDSDATLPLPTGWVDATNRARKRLTEVDGLGVSFTQAVDKYVDGLVALAEKWIDKDRETAAKALRDALKLRPKHVKAVALFAKIGNPASGWLALFDGKSLGAGWGQDVDTVWHVEDGQMIGKIVTGGYFLDHNRKLKGDFDVRMEARFLETHEGHAGFALGAAVKGPTTGTWLYVFESGEMGIREADGAEAAAQRNTFSRRLEDLPTPFDPKEWTTYEMQFRGKDVHVLVNGAEETVVERAPDREEGPIAISIQACTLAVRKVDVMQR